jgi:G:T-mismatch repair DNA endonuclease (very short patch repair protein)
MVMSNITCKICKREIHPKAFAKHLKSHKSISFDDYVKDNIDDFRFLGWAECEICGKITKSRGSKGKACSTECMARIRETWTGENASHFGHVMSDEARLRIGIANGGPKPVGWVNPTTRPEVRAKISATRIKNGLSAGEKNPMFGKTHTPEAIEKMMSLRSKNKLETKVANELDRLGIEYHYGFFIHDGQTCGSYDFKLKNKPVIIEIDGDYWHGNPNTKHHFWGAEKARVKDRIKEDMAAARGYEVIRFWESDIKKDISIIETKLTKMSILTHPITK